MRDIIEFPKKRWGLKSKCKKLGVKRLDRRVVKERDVLILGTGRCGTTTIAKVIEQTFDVDMQREKVGKYGTASLYFTVDSDWYPRWLWPSEANTGRVHYGERRSDFVFKHVLHVVRHPAKTIPSMCKIFPTINNEFFEDNGLLPPGIRSRTLRMAHVYYNINLQAQAQAEYRFKIEELKSEWREILRILDLPYTALREVPVANRATGFRKSEPLDWNELDQLDHTLCRSIQKMATKYGYE